MLQAKSELQKRARDDEQLMASTESMLQQLQASLAIAKLKLTAHQDALASSQSAAESLKRKLDTTEQTKSDQDASTRRLCQRLEGERGELEKQLQQVKSSLLDAQASASAKAAQVSQLEAALKGIASGLWTLVLPASKKESLCTALGKPWSSSPRLYVP